MCICNLELLVDFNLVVAKMTAELLPNLLGIC